MVRMFKKSPKHLQNDWRTIGITGTGPCVGTTHFCILYANYLTGVEQRKTAVLEWNQNGDLERMEAVCTGQVKAVKPYEVLDVAYFKCAGARELAICMEQDFERILIDFGCGACHRLDFLRCSRKAVILSFSEWQLGACLEFLNSNEDRQNKSWQYYTLFGSEESRRKLEKTFKLTLKRIPFSEDAFTVTEEVMAFFADI